VQKSLLLCTPANVKLIKILLLIISQESAPHPDAISNPGQTHQIHQAVKTHQAMQTMRVCSTHMDNSLFLGYNAGSRRLQAAFVRAGNRYLYGV
jgi:hypothetical protein